MRLSWMGGGLKVTKWAAPHVFRSSPDEVAPAYIDSRPYCTMTEDQGPSSCCAGVTMSSYLEVQEWKRTRIPRALGWAPLYRKAKEIDGDATPGTTFPAVFKAAQMLGWAPVSATMQGVDSVREVRHALHRYDVAMAGVMATRAWYKADSATGLIPDEPSEGLGGHAILLCWYDAESVGFQNSWGVDWGVRGFGRMSWKQLSESYLDGAVVNYEGIT